MEQIVIQPEEKADDQQKHNDEMVKKVDGVTTPETPPESKLFAGKYKTIEELEKGYAELSKKLGAPKDEPPDTGDAPADKKVENPPVDDPLTQDAEFKPFFDEFAKDGKLSDKSYEALAAKGLSKKVVDNYIAGQQAIQKNAEAEAVKARDEIFSLVGNGNAKTGETKYTEMIEWAAKNLSKEDIAAYNDSMVGTSAQAKLAVAGLFAKFSKANKEDNLILGDGSGGSVGDVYESRAQMTRDMATELYKKDPAERKRVMDKISRSKIL